jgi:hypothetical protein
MKTVIIICNKSRLLCLDWVLAAMLIEKGFEETIPEKRLVDQRQPKDAHSLDNFTT